MGKSPPEYFVQLRALRKKLLLCQRCGKKDAYTMAGRCRCAECAEKEAEYKRLYYAENKAKKAESDKKYAQRKRADGYCQRCHVRKTALGYKTCPRCLAYARAYDQEHKNQAVNWPRGANGICWLCNKRPALQGRKLCAACYDRRCISNRSRDNSRHVWRRMDREVIKKW